MFLILNLPSEKLVPSYLLLLKMNNSDIGCLQLGCSLSDVRISNVGFSITSTPMALIMTRFCVRQYMLKIFVAQRPY